MAGGRVTLLPLYSSFFSFGFFSALFIAFFIANEHAAHQTMFVSVSNVRGPDSSFGY